MGEFSLTMGIFEQPVGDDPVSGVVGGYPKGNGPKCPECKSRNTEAISRDIIWDETKCQCLDCRHVFIK